MAVRPGSQEVVEPQRKILQVVHLLTLELVLLDGRLSAWVDCSIIVGSRGFDLMVRLCRTVVVGVVRTGNNHRVRLDTLDSTSKYLNTVKN